MDAPVPKFVSVPVLQNLNDIVVPGHVTSGVSLALIHVSQHDHPNAHALPQNGDSGKGSS